MPHAIDDRIEALLLLAAAIAAGDPARLAERTRTARSAGVPAHWVDELILQSVLTVGWPRALVAAETWRAISGPAAPSGAPGPDDPGEWRRRGEATCRVIYGPNYQRLRANVRALHPELDDWLITDSYGRILSRPGLELRLREFCTVAQTAVLDTPRQLHSHLLGALRAGASADDMERVMAIIATTLGPEQRRAVAEVWSTVRAGPAR